jgi:hypothetical protein
MFIWRESVGEFLRGRRESITQLVSMKLIQPNGCRLPTHEYRLTRAGYCIGNGMLLISVQITAY